MILLKQNLNFRAQAGSGAAGRFSVKKTDGSLGIFTACARVGSLLETTLEAAKTAAVCDAAFTSPVCSSFELLQNLNQNGRKNWLSLESISWGQIAASPKIHGQCGEMLKKSRQKME